MSLPTTIRTSLALLGTLIAFAPARAALGAETVSDERDRKEVSLTVYNSNFALIREVRELAKLGTGRVALEFRDVASTIQPETVAVRASSGGGLRVLEQNYRFDLLTPQTLLEKYVGRNVRAYRYHESTGKEDAVDAKLLSVVEGPILQIGQEITFNYPGRLAFAELPPNLIPKPTLMWLLESQAPKQSVEVTYLAQQLSWHADYVLTVNDAESQGDLVGWVTLTNNSGSSYRNASLKLVAGDVNRVSPVPQRPGARYKTYDAAGASAFSEEALLEYHLYTLDRPADVLDKEQKQVTLIEAPSVGISKKLIFASQPQWFMAQVGPVQTNQKVAVYLDFKNTQANRLGIPLPKGTVRVYKADKAGKKQFVGEDSIDHTPRDEKVRVKVGEAFDVVADRKQMEWHQLGECNAESAWQIELRNHKAEDISVEVREPVNGDFSVVESSLPWKKEDANTFTFDVKVPRGGNAKVMYKVRVKWC
ncbi:MAG TPA: DUF4139 domain-containing protein [Polyangiaceae bacterium]|nr:DUF4139 domain-containing protein [Polyangiaceae bacterium]